MIVQLGKTEIKYNTPPTDDFLIVSCIPTSSMSTDRPTLIRTVQDLRLNFGEEFPEYSYLVELLEQGVTLYIMGPSLPEENARQEGYVQLTGYASGFWIEGKTESLSGLKTLPGKGSTGTIYKVVKEEGEFIGGPTGKYSEMTYLEGWINVQDLPQNTWINTDSQNNRDTLRICEEPGMHCHPKYGSSFQHTTPVSSQFYRYRDGEWQALEGIWDSPDYIFDSFQDLTERVKRPREEEYARIDTPIPLQAWKIDEGDETLAFLVEGNTTFEEGEFVVLGDTLYGNVLENDPIREYVRRVVKVLSTDEFLRECQKWGWKVEGKYVMPGTLSSKVTYFYNHHALKVEPDWNKSQELLASWTTPILDYSSKTIGSEGIESLISVKAENLEEPGTQRITISRYEYVEVFEGTWKKGLDHQISRESKLVNVEYYGEGNPPEGEWKLMGATGLGDLKKEKTLEFIFKGEVGIDFFLSYGDLPQDLLLGYALQKDCQVLVQNDGEDYKDNLTDTTNHLLFFYRPMLLFGALERPAWYVWLRGLLSDVYSDTVENISYDSPAPYYDEDNKLCRDLKAHRSNYMTASGLDLFYRSYTWMGDKETAFVRFVLGKIRRELEKHKWDYIGPGPGGKTIPEIERILGRVQKSFGMIRSIRIEDYDFYYRQNMIELTLETRVSDLVDQDITLDITLNYNK